jgi:hypothetical protein
MMRRMRRCVVEILAAASSIVALDAAAADASAAVEPRERYIPVELWAGTEWDGKSELKMPPVSSNYRHRASSYQIKGPIEWKHPVTGRMYTAYERNEFERSGTKTQMFTINEEKSGLGRLFDRRPGRETRTYSGGLKFPLGVWKEGETRTFAYTALDSRQSERAETITITQIDFTFQGTPHCLEFRWLATDAAGKTVYDQHTYTYCPGKSMAHEIHY